MLVTNSYVFDDHDPYRVGTTGHDLAASISFSVDVYPLIAASVTDSALGFGARVSSGLPIFDPFYAAEVMSPYT